MRNGNEGMDSNSMFQPTRHGQPQWSPPASPPIPWPAKLQGYNQIARIEGGMGVVFRAFDTNLEIEVAVKRLRSGIAAGEELLERFLREARTQASLKGTDFVSVLSFDSDEHGPWLIMEWIPGGTLWDWHTRHNEQGPWPDAVDICRKVAISVQKLHDAGCVHRDLKPSNILFRADKTPVVSDFGLVRNLQPSNWAAVRTESGRFLGTPPFAAPEQANSRDADEATDQWSLAAVLHFLLTNKSPILWAKDFGTSSLQIREDLMRQRGMPAHVCRTVVKALSQEPSQRFGSMAEFAAALNPDVVRSPRWLLWSCGAAVAGTLFMLAPTRNSAVPDRSPKPPLTSANESIPSIPLVRVAPVRFLMGEADDGIGDRPQHSVSLTRPLDVSRTEITQAQWFEVMQTRPWLKQPDVPQGDNFPAVCISYPEARRFCERLTQLLGRSVRLPTEAEWEGFCRAGTNTRWSCGDSEEELAGCAWYADSIEQTTGGPQPVGRLQPNALGLYDLHGNVFEWCEDWYVANYYQTSPEQDPRGPAMPQPPSGGGDPARRVLRGGSWARNAQTCASSFRYALPENHADAQTGLRIVVEVEAAVAGG